jgi:hypothetical protein
MSTFGAVSEQAEARIPPDAITVPARAFSLDWEERPLGDVCLGLRPLPARDLEDARKAAADAASRLYPRASEGEPFFSLFADHYHDMLLRNIVSRGTCDPNDVTQPWEGWREDPDELARTHLTTEGTQLIFDAWERMKLANDVSAKPASDDDVEDLIDRVTTIDHLPRGRAMRVRRLLAFCLAELRTLEPTIDP